jgi:tetratricopeptide (TPR) repeat protein/transcriptional regulator with XRE-family HTH domain
MPEPASSLPLASLVTFGDLLKYLRRRARLTQRELSIAVGYSEGHISRLEADQRPPDPATLMALFVPALKLEDEPGAVARLLELAAAARGESGLESITYTRAVGFEITEEVTHVEYTPTSPRGSSPPHQVTRRVARGRLVGRDREMARGSTLWRQAAGGEASVLLVSGEPGIGKTRLVRELAALAESSGGRALGGECHAEGSAPYAPAAQIIRAALDVQGLRNPAGLPDVPAYVLADLITLAPDLRVRYPDVPSNPKLDPYSEQQRLHESVFELCARLAERAPLLVFVEDMHWADTSTLSLLRHLCRRAVKAPQASPLLIILTYREAEGEGASALNGVLLDLNRERLAEHISLARLSREQTGDLVTAILGDSQGLQDPAGLDFVEGLYRQTEGNPFFVEEVCQTLMDAGELHDAHGRWRRPDAAAILIPKTVTGAILSRVARLPVSCQEALRLAAVLGPEFDFDTLSEAGGHGGEGGSVQAEEALINALEQAERAQLISEVQRERGVTFAFTHPLIPAALRQSLSGPRLQRLHRRAALALEARRPEAHEALADHFAAAAVKDKALEHARRAAERAEAVYAYEDAIRYLRAVLDLLEPGEQPETRIAVLERLADVHNQLQEGSRAIPLYQEALDLWPSLPGADKWTAVRLHRKVGQAANRLNLQSDRQRFEAASRASLEAGLKLTEGESAHPETIHLLSELASRNTWYFGFEPDLAAAEHYARAAIDMSERLDMPAEISHSLGSLVAVYTARGLFRELVQIAQRRLALSRDPRFGDMRERLELLIQAGIALEQVGEYAEAMPHFLEAESLATKMRHMQRVAEVLGLQGRCLWQLDRWEEMLAIDGKWRALRERFPLERLIGHVCFYLGISAQVHGLRGEMELARSLREESVQVMVAFTGAPEIWERNQHY